MPMQSPAAMIVRPIENYNLSFCNTDEEAHADEEAMHAARHKL